MSNNKIVNQEIIKTALPIIFSNLIVNLSGFFSAMMIGRLCFSALPACALIYSSLSVLLMIVYSFGISITLISANMLASNQQNKIKYVFQDGVSLIVFVGFILLFAMLNLKPLLLFLRQPVETCTIVNDYFKSYAYGFLPMLITVIIQQLLVGIGYAKWTLYFTLLNCLVALLLTYLFLKYIPFQPLGIEGAGYAASVSHWLVLMVELIFLKSQSKFKTLDLFNWSFCFCYIKSIFILACSISIQRSTELLALFMMTIIMGWLGDSVLSAQQILIQISMIFLIISFGFMQTAGVLVSKSYNKVLAKKYLLHIIIMSTLCMLILVISFYLVMHQIISLFITNADVHAHSLIYSLIPISLFTLLFDNVRNVTIGALRGLQDRIKPVLYTVITFWVVSLPFAYLFSFVMHFGALGVLIGWLCGIVVGTILVVYRSYVLMHTA